MTKTFAEIIKGIRKAVLGVEVREDIAQGMEYVEQFATTATQKADEAATSASEAKQAKQDTEAAKETAVSAIDTAKSDATTKIETAKSGALTAIGEGKTEGLNALDKKQQEALDAVSGAVNTAQEAAGTATTQAAAATRQATAAAGSASAAKASEKAADGSAQNAKASEEAAAKSAAEAKAATGFDPDNYYNKSEADAKFGTPYTLPAATSAVLGGVKVGNNFSIAADGTISLTGENVTNALAYTPATKDAATQSTPGLMSAADKKKLDSLDSTGSIVASGTNYIRFADGTQICWRTFGSWSWIGQLNYFDFPVPFIDKNYAVGFTLGESISSSSNVNCYARYDFKSGGNTTTRLVMSSAYYGSAIVIGRWK